MKAKQLKQDILNQYESIGFPYLTKLQTTCFHLTLSFSKK